MMPKQMFIMLVLGTVAANKTTTTMAATTTMGATTTTTTMRTCAPPEDHARHIAAYMTCVKQTCGDANASILQIIVPNVQVVCPVIAQGLQLIGKNCTASTTEGFAMAAQMLNVTVVAKLSAPLVDFTVQDICCHSCSTLAAATTAKPTTTTMAATTTIAGNITTTMAGTTTVGTVQYSGSMTITMTNVTQSVMQSAMVKALAAQFDVAESAVSVTATESRRLEETSERRLGGNWAITFTITASAAKASAIATKISTLASDSTALKTALSSELQAAGVDMVANTLGVSGFSAATVTTTVGPQDTTSSSRKAQGVIGLVLTLVANLLSSQ